MKRITLNRPVPTHDTPLYMDTISEDEPIFARRDGHIKGMVIKEENTGWILRVGGTNGSCGHFNTRAELLRHLEEKYKYTLHVGHD